MDNLLNRPKSIDDPCSCFTIQGLSFRHMEIAFHSFQKGFALSLHSYLTTVCESNDKAVSFEVVMHQSLYPRPSLTGMGGDNNI